jgi:hypothetical protein
MTNANLNKGFSYSKIAQSEIVDVLYILLRVFDNMKTVLVIK